MSTVLSSERVSKSNVHGVLLTEAKYINLSLHYLEQVIVALSEKNRSHIPYRNSMMTSVLRDSLGGNCMTTMIATCSLDQRNVEVSTNTFLRSIDSLLHRPGIDIHVPFCSTCGLDKKQCHPQRRSRSTLNH